MSALIEPVLQYLHALVWPFSSARLCCCPLWWPRSLRRI